MGTLPLKIIEERLERSTREEPSEDDFRPIAYLRQFSNYLTPKVSVFSADTWVVAAIWGRNTVLNQTILLGILTVVLVLARLLGAAVPPSGPGLPQWERKLTSLWMMVGELASPAHGKHCGCL